MQRLTEVVEAPADLSIRKVEGGPGSLLELFRYQSRIGINNHAVADTVKSSQLDQKVLELGGTEHLSSR